VIKMQQQPEGKNHGKIREWTRKRRSAFKRRKKNRPGPGQTADKTGSNQAIAETQRTIKRNHLERWAGSGKQSGVGHTLTQPPAAENLRTAAREGGIGKPAQTAGPSNSARKGWHCQTLIRREKRGCSKPRGGNEVGNRGRMDGKIGFHNGLGKKTKKTRGCPLAKHH